VGADDTPFDQETFSESYARRLGPLPRPRTADATLWIGVTLVVAGLLLALIKVGDYYEWANFLADRSDFIHWLASKRGS
jgi:hypothetical protein